MVGYACGHWTRQTAMTEEGTGTAAGQPSSQRHCRGYSSGSRATREADRWTVTKAAAGEAGGAGSRGRRSGNRVSSWGPSSAGCRRRTE